MARNKKQPKGISFKDNFSTVNSSCLHIFLRLVILGIFFESIFQELEIKVYSTWQKGRLCFFGKIIVKKLLKLSKKIVP